MAVPTLPSKILLWNSDKEFIVYSQSLRIDLL